VLLVDGVQPWSRVLSDTQAAAVLSHARASWGKAAPRVTPPEVNG
jgi:hypothetical protein